LKSVAEVLIEVLRIDPADVAKNLTMQDVETWNSLTHLELVITFEDSCSIQLSGDDIVAMTSFDGLRQVLAAHGVPAQ
jgi:acyl carrier protein